MRKREKERQYEGVDDSSISYDHTERVLNPMMNWEEAVLAPGFMMMMMLIVNCIQ